MLETLVNNLEGMIFRCRIDEHWTLLFASCGCQHLTGYLPEDLVGNKQISYHMMTHEDDRNTVSNHILNEIHEKRRYRIEYRIRREDGVIRWVSENGQAVVSENGEQVLEAFVHDITEQVKAKSELALAEARYRSIFEHISEGIFQTTADGRYLDANQALANIYGYSSPGELVAELKDIETQLYVQSEQRDIFKRLISECGQIRGFEAQIKRRDGNVIWIEEDARAVYSPDGTFLYYEGTVRDITESKNYQHQLEHNAKHDQLTGLPNRNLLADRLQQSIREAQRNSHFSVVAFIDLDNFKYINDSLGHLAGDKLLIEIADRLKECLRSSDTVARYGGDEFVLVLNGYYQIGQIIAVLERIKKRISEPVRIEGQELFVSCSIGISQYPHDGDTPQILMQHADAAMYLAKDKGKNNFQFFTTHLNTLAVDRMKIESGLRRALENREFQIHFQPKVNINGICTGAEALARWHSKEIGWISPNQFVEIAEDSGLILPLTEFLMKETCVQAKSILQRGYDISFAFNLSAQAFKHQNLTRIIADILQETGFPAEKLELEITESAMIGDIERCIETLHSLKHMGVRIAIDDFGTGYSSLNYLQRFPIDTLKIDRSFVNCMQHPMEESPIPAAIISLGQSLNLHVVAEGVETENQYDALKYLGCDEFQGYLFSKALPLTEFEKYCHICFNMEQSEISTLFTSDKDSHANGEDSNSASTSYIAANLTTHAIRPKILHSIPTETR